MLDNSICQNARRITKDQIAEFIKVSIKEHSVKTEQVDFQSTWKRMSVASLCSDPSLIGYLSSYGFTLHPCDTRKISALAMCANVFSDTAPPPLEVNIFPLILHFVSNKMSAFFGRIISWKNIPSSSVQQVFLILCITSMGASLVW